MGEKHTCGCWDCCVKKEEERSDGGESKPEGEREQGLREAEGVGKEEEGKLWEVLSATKSELEAVTSTSENSIPFVSIIPPKVDAQ